MEDAVLKTKLLVPPPQSQLVSRSRLDAPLQRVLEHPLTLVSAPAGFGKTTAIHGHPGRRPNPTGGDGRSAGLVNA
jgi:LuxR family maltose regulon positive regulatory protein